MSCLLPGYTRKQSLDRRRVYIRRFHLPTVAGFCEDCQKFHVRLKPPQSPLHSTQKLGSSELRVCTEKWQEIVMLMAQGYRDREIAGIIGQSEKTVLRTISEYLMEYFQAMSRPHLVAILIALGVIDPSTFVPQEENLAQHG